MGILELIFSAGSGGLLGLLGSGFKQFMSWKDKKLTLEFELKTMDKQAELMQLESELALQEKAIDREIKEDENDARSLQAALLAESKITGTSQWVADLRGSVRPVLTYALAILSIVMAWNSPGNPWVNEVVFMAMTAVGYWFGDRPPRRS